ncbi:MAG: bis-aminopropyl spermidine synthase family protein [Candidatus Diapherotrites archaeon]|nr:bis-aminopropyl spermidine synthase family protein [Candidatus Diapherotrites archaeon]
MGGEARTRRQVRNALASGRKSFWEIVKAQDSTLRELVSEMNRLPEDEGTRGPDEKKGSRQDHECGACRARTVLPYAGIMEKYKRIVGERLDDKGVFHQEKINEEAVAAKVAFIDQRGDLEGTDILVIGDDDFLGVALALTDLPNSVTVIDIDQRVVDATNRLAGENGLRLKAMHYDVQEPLPPSLERSFDAFVTEQPETICAMEVFFSRGAQALRADGAGYFGLTTLESSTRKWREVQEKLVGMGFAVTDVIRNFSDYANEESVAQHYADYEFMKALRNKPELPKTGEAWYRSALVRVEAVGEPTPLITGKTQYSKEFYMDEETWSTSEKAITDTKKENI